MLPIDPKKSLPELPDPKSNKPAWALVGIAKVNTMIKVHKYWTVAGIFKNINIGHQ